MRALNEYERALTRKGSYFAAIDEAAGVVAWYHEKVHGFRDKPVRGWVPPATVRDVPREIVKGWEPNPACLIPADAIAISDEEYETWRDPAWEWTPERLAMLAARARP